MSHENSVAGAGTPEVHDELDVEEALHELEAHELGRLRLVAHGIVRAMGLETAERDHEDLLAEALVRTVSGSRAWRRGVDFTRHLSYAMESVAWVWRERQDSRARRGALASWEDELLTPGADGATGPPGLFAPEPDAETAIILRERVAAFERRFAGDTAARAVLDGWRTGRKRPEVLRRAGLSKKQYQAAVRRVRRHAQQGDDHDQR